jgi:hypothetical protein
MLHLDFAVEDPDAVALPGLTLHAGDNSTLAGSLATLGR